jgi:hypothetical protein
MISGRTTVGWCSCHLLAVFPTLLLIGCLSHTAFQGGKLTRSRGPFFTSLYLAEFQELDLNKNGDYIMAFRGFPSGSALLDIDLIGRSIRDEALVERSISRVTLELDKEDGGHVCKAAGLLNQIRGIQDHHWVLAASADSLSLWNPDCVELKLRRSRAYTLKIRVEGANQASGPLKARPRLYTPSP